MSKLTKSVGALFYDELSKLLTGASYSTVEENTNLRVIKGRIITEQFEANIVVIFNPNSLKRDTPTVICEEEWIQKELDWHYLAARDISGWRGRSSLCWIHPMEWLVAHEGRVKKVNQLVDDGARWLVNNVTYLLALHWLGHKLGIKHWRSDWPQWQHGEKGNEEYLAEIRDKGYASNWKPLWMEI